MALQCDYCNKKLKDDGFVFINKDKTVWELICNKCINEQNSVFHFAANKIRTPSHAISWLIYLHKKELLKNTDFIPILNKMFGDQLIGLFE